MKHCCENKGAELTKLRASQARVLKLVLAINAAMFLIEAAAGIVGRSTALLADSLDMFGDATVYAFSLYVIDRGTQWRARAAFLKGAIMAVFGLGVLARVAYQALFGVMPVGEAMGLVAALALAANTACLILLYRHRTDDLNMRSTWLCSRNDLIANAGVIGAAIAVLRMNTFWPDVIVGSLIAALFISSATGVLRESWAEIERGPKTSRISGPL